MIADMYGKLPAVLAVAGLVGGCAAGNVGSQKTANYRDASYRTIGPGKGEPPSGFHREPLSEALETEAWEIMKIQLVPKRWEFADVRGHDLVVYWGLGPAPGDRADRIEESTLVVDVFERRENRRVWFGYARDMAPLTKEKLRDALNEILLGFPRLPPRPVAY